MLCEWAGLCERVLNNSIHRELRDPVVFKWLTGARIFCAGLEGVTSAGIFGHGSLSGALSKSDSPRSMGGVPDHVDSTSEVDAKATLSRKVDSGVSPSSSSFSFAADVIRGARDVHCHVQPHKDPLKWCSLLLAAASAPPAGPHGGTSFGLRRGPPVAPSVEVHCLCDKPCGRGPQRRPPRQGPKGFAWGN